MSDRPTSMSVQKTEVTAVKDFQVTGGTVTFGDIHQSQIGQQTILQQKPEFFELIKEPEFLSPQITPTLTEDVRKHRLLVLGGSLDIDKDNLARHLAWQLAKKLKNQATYSSYNIPIKEWQRSSDPQSIDVELQKTENTTIFVLTQVSPQNVGYDLSRIQKAAASGQHYLLVSTDVTFVGWKQPESAKGFWRELSVEDVYSQEDLVNILVHELNNAGKSSLLAECSRWEVAQRLKTPNKIAGFVQLLNPEKESGDEERSRLLQERTVDNLISLVVNQTNKETLQNWYNTSLTPREQLLALGLSFFNGMFEDQFFAALEEIVEGVWQKRDVSLRALDYCDLDNLRYYFDYFPLKAYGSKLNGFTFVKTKDEATEIEISRIDIRRSDERRLLFEVAWESHRRQILTALPIIVQLVKESVAKESFKWELYGGEVRCNQLRNAICETLSALGVVKTSATSAVQGALVQLAAEPEFEVQDVAARAIARWRDPDYNCDQEVFGTLQRLYSIAIQAKNNPEEIEEQQHYIGATVALTVSYAAVYDPPDYLCEELCDWLKELSESKSPLVRIYFGYHTLFYVVAQHLVQLRDILKKIAQQHADLNEAIARSLARAYRNKPEEVVNTLDLWSKECVQNLLKPINTTRLTERDSLLATVALTYGEIQCEEGIGMLTAEEVFRRLSKILTGERHFFVRRAVLTAICNQARQRFDQIEGQLQDLIPNVTDSECNNIVETITEIYLKQREKLDGGDDIVEVNKRRYQVWFDSSKHPKTVVEEAMIRWVKDETKAVSQQVAMQALVNFARVLDLEEESSLKKLQQEKRGLTRPEIYTLESFDNFVTIGETQIGFYSAQLVSWLATLKAKHYQAVIRNIMPEVMKQHNSRREVMSFVLNRWSRVTDNEIRTISGLLKYGLLLAENFGAIVLAMGTLLTLTGIAVVNISQNLPVSTSPSSPNSSVVSTPSSSATPTITQQEAINLVYTWLQAKSRIFAPPYDRQLVADLTTDERYTKTIAAIEGLQKDNAYYKYGPSEVEATGEFFSPESNQIIIGVKVTEDYTYYVNDQVVPSESKSGTEVYRLLFKLEDGRWKIAKTIR